MATKKRKNEEQDESVKRFCLTLDCKFVEVKDALNQVKTLFSSHLFGDNFPPIIWKHQCYPLIKNRTKVDMDLNKLCDEGMIRSFKLGTTINDNETALVFMNDFISYLKSCYDGKALDKFINQVLTQSPSMSYTSSQLKDEFGLTNDEITELVRNGVLAVHRTVGSWLLSLPSCGSFYKTFVAGRKAILNMVKRTRYNEIMRTELLTRKMPKDVKLGISYHVLDLLGADYVECIESPTGIILRLQQ